MFDHQDGASGRHALDELGHAVHVFVAHALRGFVQQHQLGLHGQRGGDLERTLAAVGQVHGLFVGQFFEAHLGEQLAGARIERLERLLALPEVVRGAQLALQAQAHVLEQREVREHGGDLERADHAASRDLRRAFARDVVAVEQDRAGRGLEEFGEQVEAGRLAGTVGADERVDRTALHREVDLADRGESLEFLGELACFKNDVAHLAASSVCGKKKSVMRSISMRHHRARTDCWWLLCNCILGQMPMLHCNHSQSAPPLCERLSSRRHCAPQHAHLRTRDACTRTIMRMSSTHARFVKNWRARCAATMRFHPD
ncbi:hypothetical protein D9M72_371890 [compost metagenome]